jgi:hypothetical protein
MSPLNTSLNVFARALVTGPKPYKLQWVNDSEEVKVNKHVLVSFSIGRYKDEVLCDVVPMHAGHIQLGKPWQFDRKAMRSTGATCAKERWNVQDMCLLQSH